MEERRATMILGVKQALERVKRVPGLARTIEDSAHIIEDVGLDSLEMMEFMLELESSLSLIIDFERIEFSHFESLETFSELLATMASSDA